jgi:hypothetical protein
MINRMTGEPILPARTADQYLARYWFALWLSHFALRPSYLTRILPHFTRAPRPLHSSFPISWDLLHRPSSLLPPLTLWLPHFASCLPHLQWAPFHFAQAPPLLLLQPPVAWADLLPTAHHAQASAMYIYSDNLINDNLNK